ncbi:MarR family transcriptional regulator [Clostridium sp.]|uniref:MarR family winged helix-turn-helix transcriptional regulator n=1 Tax=Clostridium sp. TaxID=1506 RepID=UPI002FC802BD
MEDKDLDLVIDNILYILPLINKKLIRPIFQMVKKEIPPYHFQILNFLLEQETATISEISSILCVSRPNTTPLIDKLYQEGLIHRTPNPKDRRIIDISITENGRRVAIDNFELFRDKLKSKISSLEKNDIDSFFNSLENIKVILNKMESN